MCKQQTATHIYTKYIYTVVGVCAHEQAPVLKSLNLFNFHQLSLSGISKEFKKRGSAWG